MRPSSPLAAPWRGLTAAVLLTAFVAGQQPLTSVSETFARLYPARAKTFVKASSDPDERLNAVLMGNDDGFSGVNQVEAYRKRIGVDDVAVLADVKGRAGFMGVFFRNFWSGYFGMPVQLQEQNRAQILIDGAVAHDHLLPDYFRNQSDPRGQLPPFVGPFTGSRAGGHLTHVPLVWQDEFQVRVFENSFDNAGRFHKVAGTLQPPENSVPVPDLAAWETVYSRIGGWRHDVRRRTGSWPLTVPAHGSRTISLNGPSTILELRCSVTDPNAWNDLVARFTWDGAAQPAVDVPLRMLGGLMRRPFRHAFDSLLFGNDGDYEIWTYFPMPFASVAHLEFVNNGASPVGLKVTVAQDRALPPDPWGHFAVTWQRGVTATGVPFQGPTLQGVRGMLRALLLETSADTSGRMTNVDLMHLEGDLCIRINGDRGDEHNFAATETSIGKWGWYGTPSDQAFCSDASFNTGFQVVAHPNGVLESDRVQGSTYVFDPVNFVDGIDIVLEHGVQNLSNADYGLMSVFYLQDGAARDEIATVDVGDAIDESNYNVRYGVAPASVLFGTFFRDQFYQTPPITDDVRDVRDWYRFQLTVPTPNQWHGLCLGFRLDRQRVGDGGVCDAQIYVDGTYAGLLHSYTSNQLNRWKEGGEVEVELPRGLTDGKGALTIEIRHVTGTEPLVIGQVKVYGYARD